MNTKISALFASACLVAVCVASSADAQPQIVKLSPAQAQQLIQLSTVKGTITIAPAALAAPNAAFACKDITVYAASKEQTTCAPGGGDGAGGFCGPQPKWTRHTQAVLSGNTCVYTMIVPYNQPFAVSATTDFVAPGECGTNYLQTTGIGTYVATSQRAASVTQNFTVKGVSYTDCPH